MANGKLLRQLIKSGVQGETSGFRAASEAVIQEEREKNHHLLANDLERLLYGDRASAGRERKLHALVDLPASKDSGMALLEERVVIRDEKDIILSDATHAALDEILMEHNRADVLRSCGMRPAENFSFVARPVAARPWLPK
jgi:hypothetical protein